MSRLPIDDDARRRGEGAAQGESAASGRSAVTPLDDAGGSAHARRQREDPRGRRSLTGLEFRRQRSR